MNFLSKLASDLKASASKSISNAYTSNLKKAEEQVNKLFTTMKVGDVADFKNETIPSTAIPLGANAAPPVMPAALAQTNYAGMALLAAVVAFVAWLIFKE